MARRGSCDARFISSSVIVGFIIEGVCIVDKRESDVRITVRATFDMGCRVSARHSPCRPGRGGMNFNQYAANDFGRGEIRGVRDSIHGQFQQFPICQYTNPPTNPSDYATQQNWAMRGETYHPAPGHFAENAPYGSEYCVSNQSGRGYGRGENSVPDIVERKIFFGGLLSSVNENVIHAYFSQYGPISRLDVMTYFNVSG